MCNLRLRFIYLLVLIQLVHRILSDGDDRQEDDNNDKTWMYFPDGEGNILVASLTNETSRGRAEPVLADISFELYTRQHHTVTSEHASRQQPGWKHFEAMFEPDIETKILIHGWESDTQSTFVQSVKNNYLKTRNCNVIGELLAMFSFKVTIRLAGFSAISIYSYCVAIEESELFADGRRNKICGCSRCTVDRLFAY